ncbi:ABC transporter ATP-binding protein [Planctellipticum variicoloris]|uniref:ABC transporter ATP-binding protein n=1 Tax=Planctellipticum variicoloris TaxID=3064265 RepID=UPI0030141775|nr:ABC transporter ATP-binding protein [Planctomycetaceae bacterium SH412]
MNPAVDRYLELWRVTKSYPGPKGPVAVVRDFNLVVKQGEFVSLIGHSGCGKSTVLSMVAGLNEISEGGLVLAGREIDGPGPDRGVVFQSPSLLPWLTALQNVTLGIRQVRPRNSRQEIDETAIHYLELVGLGDSIHRRPGELSQGMRQRVGLARAFALNPKLLLLDEPFGMLDSLTRLELQQILIDLWQSDQKTALMVTHDVDEALLLSDRVVMMTNGPEARVGGILEIPFPRPRNRVALLEDPEFEALREQLVGFLEDHAVGHMADRVADQRAEAEAGLAADPSEGAGEAPEVRCDRQVEAVVS